MSVLQDPITVSATVKVPVEHAWTCWTLPEHITRWNAASADWHCPSAVSDLRPGGKFSYRMEARDGSMGFDFWGIFDEVQPGQFLSYTMGDGRKAEVFFKKSEAGTQIEERFEAESQNSRELQQTGWQMILDNFKRHAEARSREHPLKFSVHIEKSPLAVHEIMIAPDTYRSWTSEFNPSSRFEGSWNMGSGIIFIGEDKEGKIGGMVSRIRKNIPGESICIEHLGLVQEGKHILEGPEVEGWAGALESYSFQPEGRGTRLDVVLETNNEFAAYFENTWPAALQRLKAICEA